MPFSLRVPSARKSGLAMVCSKMPVGGDEVIEPAGLAGRGGGGADEVERAVGRHPVDRDRLDEGAAVDEDDVLGSEIFVRDER